ncbi:MAG: CRISPR-associated endonuclease Cas1, partial [Microgenomates group bacterium]
WYKRLPQSKIDQVNFLLDYGYWLLFNLIDCFTLIFGFDRYKGFYHQLYFQRKSLVCDLMEPFRSLIDATILNIFKFNIYKDSDFTLQNNTYEFKKDCKIKTKYLKFFLKSLLSHKVAIYNFVRNFYLFIGNPKKTFPQSFIDFEKLPIAIK